MKRLSILLFFLVIVLVGYSQPGDLKGFKLAGINPGKTEINQTINQSSELQLFGIAPSKIFGLAISGQVVFDNEDGLVRVILVDNNYNEYLVYEMYTLMADNQSVNIDDLCEETCLLDGVTPKLLKVEVKNASLKLNNLTTASGVPQSMDRFSRLIEVQLLKILLHQLLDGLPCPLSPLSDEQEIFLACLFPVFCFP